MSSAQSQGERLIVCGDVMEWAASYKGPKFHALLCDPPYHLTDPQVAWDTMPLNRGKPVNTKKSTGFMGKKWDGGDIAYRPETWAALAEHLLPGAFGMAFASSRGWHRLACAIEDAGLIIHPSIFGWCYGSGFPKATRIDTQIEPRSKTDRVRIDGKLCGHDGGTLNSGVDVAQTYSPPATDLARAWEGYRYGLQALKPALEPIIVFQKPYVGKPVECITETGAGALNIDGGRIEGEPWRRDTPWRDNIKGGNYYKGEVRREACEPRESHPQGRWPANFYVQHSPLCIYKGTKRVKGPHGPPARNSTFGGIFGSGAAASAVNQYADPGGKETVADWKCVEECPVRRLGEQSGERTSGVLDFSRHTDRGVQQACYGAFPGAESRKGKFGGDTGTAARFFLNVDWQLEQADPVFYCAKASRKERDAGLEGMTLQLGGMRSETSGQHITRRDGGDPGLVRNPHPTVKPLALCKWLATLLLPPEEYAPRRILVPFAGSGSEVIGAVLAGWEEVIGIENEEEYVQIAKARLEYRMKQPKQLKLEGVM